MKTKFSFIIFLFLSIFGQSIYGQVVKNVIVEHFTNTKCTICSNPNKNPAFYENLELNPDILHISYHPSSPYATCELNNHNTFQNDERTNYYDIYGSTPKLVVQGVLNPFSIPFGSDEVFSQYQDQMSEVSISIEQTKIGEESIEAIVTITTVSEHNYTDVDILVGVAEKLVEFSAPNGEDEHHDVFREAVTDITGQSLTLPDVGSSTTMTYVLPQDDEWDFSQTYFFVILNDANTKEVIQSHAASNISTSLIDVDLNSIEIYPNPTSEIINVKLNQQLVSKAMIYDLLGNKMIEKEIKAETQINISQLPSGIYFLEIDNASGRSIKKFIRQ